MPEPLQTLARAFPGIRTSDDAADRVAYARDLWPRHHLAVRAGNVAEHRPAGIVWPTSTDEVSRIVRWAHDTGTPVVPFGAGSGVCAGVLPHDGIIVLDLKRMMKWRSLDERARTLDVESGQMGLPLEEDLNRRGYTLGHFPSSILCSTVGGWVAARSAGQCSGMYGKIEDMVLALECVTGTGEVVTLRHRTSGPNLIPIVIGSEGTLAIVTSSTLRLHPKPAVRAYGGFSFPSTEHGWEAMRAEYEGEGPARKWLQHRYSVSYRQAPVFSAGLFSDTMEVAAPWSKLRGLYHGVRRALGEHVFVMAHLSHAYPDGCCIYFSFAGTAAKGAGVSGTAGWDERCEITYDRAWKAAMAAAIEAGGTLAHHHGVGRSKAPRMAHELGAGGVETVRALMRAFDPKGILNPGNLLPPSSPSPYVDDAHPKVVPA